MPAHGCVSCPENLDCCICDAHDHHTRLNYEQVLASEQEFEQEFEGAAREVFGAAAALLMNDIDGPYLSAMAEAQDAFRLCTEMLTMPRTVQAELLPKGETIYARIEDEEYMLIPTSLLAERAPTHEEEVSLVTLWDLLSEED